MFSLPGGKVGPHVSITLIYKVLKSARIFTIVSFNALGNFMISHRELCKYDGGKKKIPPRCQPFALPADKLELLLAVVQPRDDFHVKINSDFHRPLVFKSLQKIGQSCYSDLIYLGKVHRGRAVLHTSTIRPELWVPFQTGNSIFFQPAAAKRPRRSSQLISSLSESRAALSLPLMETHANPALQPAFPTFREIVHELL